MVRDSTHHLAMSTVRVTCPLSLRCHYVLFKNLYDFGNSTPFRACMVLRTNITYHLCFVVSFTRSSDSYALWVVAGHPECTNMAPSDAITAT